MLQTNDVEKKSAKSWVLLQYGISQFCHVLLHLLLIELTYLNNRNTNKPENLYVYIFSSGHVHNVVIFSLTFYFLCY